MYDAARATKAKAAATGAHIRNLGEQSMLADEGGIRTEKKWLLHAASCNDVEQMTGVPSSRRSLSTSKRIAVCEEGCSGGLSTPRGGIRTRLHQE